MMRTGPLVDSLRSAMSAPAWHLVTSLGDSGLLLPAALLIGLVLAAAGPTLRNARAWCLCIGTAGALLLGSKLAFMGWCLGSPTFDFTGFSGHAALAASVWPVAFWLMATRHGRAWQASAAVAGVMLAAWIGASRLAIDVHSNAEVAAGFMLGLAASVVFLWDASRREVPRLRWRFALPVLLLPLLAVAPNHPAPTQGLLEQIAIHLAGIERACTRADLHRS